LTEPPNIPPPPASTGFRFNGPTLISGLYLATYFTAFTALVGVILAYVWKRHAAEDWQRTHYSYLIRTFWIGIGGYAACGAVIGAAIAASEFDESNSRLVDGAAMGGGVFAALLALLLSVMLVIRCAMSLVNAQQDAPMPRPGSWTI
jgi:uncharacterized membrane protein